MKLIKPQKYNPGNLVPIASETPLSSLQFTVKKFNNRKRPSNKRILIICCFSEFGCETIGVLYCLPMILRANPGYYTIVVGWYGREYLYKHLVDEFWEIKEEFQYLREYCRAFHHTSKALASLEKELEQYGKVVPSQTLGIFCCHHICLKCNRMWGGTNYPDKCTCDSDDIQRSLFGAIDYHKENTLVKLPNPTKEVKLNDKSVAIFARARKCYGRNLPPEFYSSLISLLKYKGYCPIWLGEKVTSLPCPDPDILDLSGNRDLEYVLAVVKNCSFTIQFWTASTRLAGMMGVPYLLFESPDQIFGNGQEGFRINLSSFGPKKLVYSQYLNVLNNPEEAIDLIDKCIIEMENGDYSDVIGMVDKVACENMRNRSIKRIQ